MTDPLSDSLRWALQFGSDPAVSMADWLAREVVPDADTAEESVLREEPSSDADIQKLRTLKSAFKTLRLTGETPEDRRAGARYYAAVIAAAIVRHGVLISSQRITRLNSALSDLQSDEMIGSEIRALSARALERLENEVIPNDAS